MLNVGNVIVNGGLEWSLEMTREQKELVWYIKWHKDHVYVFSNNGEYCERL